MRLVMPEARTPVAPGRQVIRLTALLPQRSYGRDNLRWVWRSLANGAEFTSFTTGQLGEGSKARALIEALIGRKLEAGEAVDSEELVGRTCEAVLGTKENGYPRIEALP